MRFRGDLRIVSDEVGYLTYNALYTQKIHFRLDSEKRFRGLSYNIAHITPDIHCMKKE